MLSTTSINFEDFGIKSCENPIEKIRKRNPIKKISKASKRFMPGVASVCTNPFTIPLIPSNVSFTPNPIKIHAMINEVSIGTRIIILNNKVFNLFHVCDFY